MAGGRWRRAGAVLVVVGLALAVRLAWLRHDSTFQRTDEAMFLLSSLRLQGVLAATDGAALLRDLFFVASFPWGYPVLLFTFLFLEAYDWLGIAIREFTVIAPFAVLGALSSVLVYLLAARVFSRRVGLGAALAVALLPSHVAQSRTIAAWILASDLMMLTLLLFLRYLDHRRRRDALLFSACLALYVPADNLAPGTLALLLGYAWLRAAGSPAERLRQVRQVFLVPAVAVLPALSLILLLAVQAAFVARGHPTYGFLGHYLGGKFGGGLAVRPLLEALASNAGLPLLLIAGGGVVRGWVGLRRGGDERLFPLWFLCFVVPSALVRPARTVLEAYLSPVLIPLLVLGCAAGLEAVDRARRVLGRRTGTAIGVAAWALVLGAALAVIPPRIYARPFLFLGPRPIGLWGGLVYENDGAKTAGYWIRRHTAAGTVVLSDVRLFVGKYYFHRPTLSPDDPRFAPEAFQRIRAGVGVLALTAPFHATASGYLDGYRLAATVTHGGRPVLLLYSRGARPPEVLAAEEFDERFDREVGRIRSLHYPVIWEDDVPLSLSGGGRSAPL